MSDLRWHLKVKFLLFLSKAFGTGEISGVLDGDCKIGFDF